MTCPLPIVHVNFGDRSINHLLYLMDDERRKQITRYEFHSTSVDGWDRPEGARSMVGLAEIVNAHVAGGKMAGGTFILDSGSSWWQVVQEVEVAPIMESQSKKTGGLAFGPANLKVKSMLNFIKKNCFLVITHQLSQDWDAKGPIPGKYYPKQNSGVPYLVEVRLRMTKVCIKCGAPACEKADPQHVGRIHQGRLMKFHPSSLEGQVLDNPTFGLLYTMYTGKTL